MRNIVVDTGPLVALFARRDRAHPRVERFLRENPALTGSGSCRVCGHPHGATDAVQIGSGRGSDEPGSRCLNRIVTWRGASRPEARSSLET